MRHPAQRTLEDLGTPLSEVTFVVFDTETTGTSPASAGITEIGALKLRGGECLGTFSTLVNPGLAVPPVITLLTGISEAMLAPAPRIEEVLGTFEDFCGSAVLVGHNVSFDVRFVEAARRAIGLGPLPGAKIDTASLARRLLAGEVPDFRLATLAARLRLDHRPSHRALDDALATADLLHALLERAATWGALGLADLLELPRLGGHPQAAKLRLTNDLPRSPGVYLFRDGAGSLLYVGKASDLRARVRSYFARDDRRKVPGLLRQLGSIEHISCAHPLEAAALEARLIAANQPPFNQRGTRWRSYAYVRLTLEERFPRLVVSHSAARRPASLVIGPLPSSSAARAVIEAVWSTTLLRRCSASRPTGAREAPCADAQLGRCKCPCAGGVDDQAYQAVVEEVVAGLTRSPALLLERISARMQALADAQRYEEAAAARDRAAALARAVRRQRRIDALRDAGRLVVRTPQEGLVTIEDARLCVAVPEGACAQARGVRAGPGETGLPEAGLPEARLPGAGLAGAGLAGAGLAGATAERTWRAPLGRELVDEALVLAGWLAMRARVVDVVSCTGRWQPPDEDIPCFESARPPRP